MIYQFDNFTVDDPELRLSQDDTTIPVEPKVLRLLLYLIENRNRLVRKHELLDALWPETMVTENSLTRTILLLRKALNDDARQPRYLETVPTAGYRFVAQVTVLDDTAPSPAPPLPAPTLPAPSEPPPQTQTPAQTLLTRRSILWTATAAATAGLGLWLTRRLSHRDRPRAITLTIQLLPGQTPDAPGTQLGAPVVAPDGSAIVVPLKSGSETWLFLRRLDSSQLTRLEGTLHAIYPFWSPDSQHIGFVSEAKLKRMPAAGGVPTVLCDFADPRGATWAANGTILFAPNLHGLSRISENGGPVAEVTQLDRSATENSHRFPLFLPDGNRFLYYARTDDPDHRGIYLESLDRKQPRRRILLADGQFALGLDDLSGNHFLITGQGGKTVAQSIDPNTGAVDQTPHLILDRSGGVSASNTGVLVILSIPPLNGVLLWRDRTGRKLAQIGDLGDFWGVALSPDGRFVAIQKHEPLNGTFRIWLASVPQALFEPFSDALHVTSFAWSRDSTMILYNDGRQQKLFRRNVSPPGPETLHRPWDKSVQLQDLSPDGRYAIATLGTTTSHAQIAWSTLDDPHWQTLGTSPANGSPGALSTDGQWVAFSSTTTGDSELYVMDFPRGLERHRLSTAGGRMPRWRQDGKELFYLAKDNTLMSVAIPTPGHFEPAQPLFPVNLNSASGNQLNTAGGNQLYDVTADGQRFLIVEHAPTAASSIEMVLNWPSLLPTT